jgi:ATP-dependent helicase/nuclease subunit B
MLENKIKIIPIEQPFLRILSNYIFEKFHSQFPDLSHILIIFPNQRNKLYFRRYLLEVSTNKGFIPPTMKTIDELNEEIYELLGGKRGLALNNIERNFILKKVVDSLKIELWQDLPFLRFISVGNRLLQFFDELSKERIALESIEQHVVSGHYPERYVKNELSIIKKIYSDYKTILNKQGYSDDMDKYDAIDAHFHATMLKKLNEFEYIAFAGFVATTMLENRIIEKILTDLPAELILHTCRNGIASMNTTDKPFYQHGKLLSALGVQNAEAIAVLNGQHADHPVFHIKSTESQSHEMFHLTHVISKIKERYEPHRIAIIVTNEDTVYSITEALTGAGILYNLSTGFPLSHSILYSFLNQLKDFIDTKYHYKAFLALIKHPLLKNAVIGLNALRPLIYRLEKSMINNNFNYFESNDYADETLMPLIHVITDSVDIVTTHVPLNEYIDNLVEMLNALLSYNKEVIEKNSPDINEFFDRLINLSKLRIEKTVSEPGFKTLDFILHMLRDGTYHVRGDPMKGVQVIGLLEARNLDFDCIILPSMNEGIFPKKSEKDLFINQAVRRQTQLPYDKERENLFYYYFTEFIHGKKEVFISYVLEEKRDIRSRFVDFLVDEGMQVDDKKIPLIDSSLLLTRREVKKNKDILHSLYRWITSRGLSPTALKDYKQCSYRFYLKYLMNILEPKQIIEEAGPAEWGIIVHEALKNFYKYDFPDGITEKDFSRAQKLLHDRATKAVENTLAKKPKGITFLDAALYKRRLNEFLRYEIERFKNGFMIDKEKLEKRLKYEITVTNRNIRLYGYTDRVDIINKRYYILDYKSSSPQKKYYEIGSEFVEFQLPLYALIVSNGDFEKISGMAYYVISNTTDICAIVEEDGIKQYLHDFREQMLLPTIREILDPAKNFHQTDDTDQCQFCAYTHLCGVKNV